MIRAIKTDADYEAALARVEEIFDSAPGSPEFDELEVWGTLISVYEDRTHPVAPPTPLEVIAFIMDQQGLKQKDLVPFIGSKSEVSEVLAGEKKLSLKMIRALHEGLGIPADTLLKEPERELFVKKRRAADCWRARQKVNCHRSRSPKEHVRMGGSWKRRDGSVEICSADYHTSSPHLLPSQRTHV